MTRSKNTSSLPSLAEILHDTFSLVVKNYKMLVPVTAVSAVLSLILVIGFFSFAGSEIRSETLAGFGNFTSIMILAVILAIVFLVIQIFSSIVLIEVLSHSSESDRYSFPQAFYSSLSRFWAMVGLTLLVALLFLIFAFVGDILSGIIGILFSAVNVSWINFGFFLSDVFAIIVTVIVGLWFVFAPYFLIVEKKKVIQSVRESFFLVHGRWFAVFIRILLVYLVVFGFAVLMRFIPYLGGILVAFFTPIFISGYLYVLFISLKKS